MKSLFTTFLTVFMIACLSSVSLAQDTDTGLDSASDTGEASFRDQIVEKFKGIEESVDSASKAVLKNLERVPFYNLAEPFGEDEPHSDADGNPIIGPTGEVVKTQVPVIVVWLVIGALFFTCFYRFVNLRLFRHAIQVVRGKYDNPDDQGEVTHFQALSTALSATVGLGNIGGVAVAISIGGPGATVWMIVAGFLGMTLKFTECTLGQKYRHIDADGRVSGGPMHYLYDGFKKRNLGWLGAILSFVFIVFCVGASFGGGNAFQVSQSLGVLENQAPFFKDFPWVYGVGMALLVGLVIIGGIKRIAHTAEKIVPTMCTVYVLAALALIMTHITEIPGAIGLMLTSAFTGNAVYGGAIGALIMGFRRAVFSNEAGVGSAAIAHSAAKTEYPVREGIVALLEPFIDTIVVCTMTALVIVITGVYDFSDPRYAEMIAGKEGAALTREAFASVGFLSNWFPWILLVAVILFAFSTMISWSYYGERCWTRLFGQRSSIIYKILFLLCVIFGSIASAHNILELSDLMILLLAFPNIIGLYVLGGEVKQELTEYEEKLRSGQMKSYR